MRARHLHLPLFAVLVLAGCGADDTAATPDGAAPDDQAAEAEPAGDPVDDPADEGDGDDAPSDDASDDATSGAGTVDGLQVRLELVADGLDVPNDLTDLGDGRLLLSDQAGRVHLLTDGRVAETPVLDISDRIRPPSARGNSLELGLSGIAAHPDFAQDPRLYVLFTEEPGDDAEPGVARVDVLAEFTVSGDPLQADPGSERELLRIEQRATDHVGGHMLFGPDGLLYVGLGDAGVSDEARDPTSLRGTVLRIDPTEGEPYQIPEDNPFVDGGGAPEVFAFGFRNPFRVAWLEGAGLLVADPNTTKDQEIHVVEAGGDHGWPDRHNAVRASSSCYPEGTAEALPECLEGPEGEIWTPPVVEYGRDVGQIVSGVAVYSGTAVPELSGRVLVADWRGALIVATPAGPDEPWATEPVHATLPDGDLIVGDYLWSLDSDAAGEVYAFTASRTFEDGEGAVYRIAPAS